ncbi:hypothetical protein SDC9_53362 [bioreactor metagenome]|uniref:Resolvase/invertase-type recombinase catalytic domain-containing protein n=1 Tax=bioreactor metagenome TaxID=1076179 RepID=A0A644WUA8_9ZZZZ
MILPPNLNLLDGAAIYEAQITHYTAYINSHPDWELAGIYADDGVSGTNTKKREEFNRMINDCMTGKIDKVITKSISRFARNTVDCLNYIRKLRVKNHGHVPQYYVENSHEAIIPREIFMQVQEELIRRRIVHTSPNGKNRTFSSTHSFSNMIICGGCGEFFRRIHWNNRGKKSVVWRCISRLENTGQFCDARTVLESTIEQVLVAAINQTLCDKDSFLSVLKDNIETVLSHGNDTALTDIDKRLGELQAELVKLANSKTEYDKVGDEIYRLRDEKQKVQLEIIGRDELKKRIADMGEFLRKQPTAITEYDEPLVKRLIEKVTVYEDKFTVEFKSGVTVDVIE